VQQGLFAPSSYEKKPKERPRAAVVDERQVDLFGVPLPKKNPKRATRAATATITTITTEEVYRGLSPEQFDYFQKNGRLPPSDWKHCIIFDYVLLPSLFPDIWENEKKLEKELRLIFPWYNPKNPRESLVYSVNVTTDYANAEGYASGGGVVVTLRVPSNELGLIDEYGMIKDVRNAEVIDVSERIE
jgi:hypothetical protein